MKDPLEKYEKQNRDFSITEPNIIIDRSELSKAKTHPLPLSRLEKKQTDHLSILTDCFKNTESLVQQYSTKLLPKNNY